MVFLLLRAKILSANQIEYASKTLQESENSVSKTLPDVNTVVSSANNTHLEFVHKLKISFT